MKWNAMALLPLVTKLGEYLKEGFEHYAALKLQGQDLTPEMLTLWMSLKMSAWDPQFNGKKLLDNETRTAAARFLAGVAINMVK